MSTVEGKVHGHKLLPDMIPFANKSRIFDKCISLRRMISSEAWIFLRVILALGVIQRLLKTLVCLRIFSCRTWPELFLSQVCKTSGLVSISNC